MKNEETVLAEQLVDLAPLYHHVEQTLGHITGLWSETDDGKPLAVPLAELETCPQEALTSLMTFGLSRTPLTQPSGKKIRQELILTVKESPGLANLPSHLHALAVAILETQEAIGAGEVIALPEPVEGFPDIAAFYASIPWQLDEEAGMMQEEGKEPVVLVWLAPLTHAELPRLQQTAFVDKLENALESRSESFFNLARGPL